MEAKESIIPKPYKSIETSGSRSIWDTYTSKSAVLDFPQNGYLTKLTYLNSTWPSTKAMEKKSDRSSGRPALYRRSPLFESGRKTNNAENFSKEPLRAGKAMKPPPRNLGYFT